MGVLLFGDGDCTIIPYKVMSKVGVCPESMWKYDDGPTFFKQQPDTKSYEIAQKCRVMGYARVAQDGVQLKTFRATHWGNIRVYIWVM